MEMIYYVWSAKCKKLEKVPSSMARISIRLEISVVAPPHDV